MTLPLRLRPYLLPCLVLLLSACASVPVPAPDSHAAYAAALADAAVPVRPRCCPCSLCPLVTA